MRYLLHGALVGIPSLTCLPSAHAGQAPWEGKNALDAAFLAYNNISAMRQQIGPEERVHGIVEGENWTPNSMLRGRSKLDFLTYPR